MISYEQDKWGDDRESFYEFCIAFTKWDNDCFFEFDGNGQEYRNKSVESAYQCWTQAFGFGFDKGVEHAASGARERVSAVVNSMQIL